MTTANDRRIARNSAFLYGRTLLTIAISLYTSRVVLEMLGIDNFGIYNVVGSIVTIFAFLNGTMAGATQRFLNFEMGRGNSAGLRHTFASSLLIHISIASLVVVVGETVGLWYVNTRLEIGPARLSAANWTYQLSLLACVFSIIQVPYMASVIAHERMDALAVINLINAFLRLGVALMLAFFGSFDTLVVYAVLMFAVSVLTFLCYMVYARSKFAEARFSRYVPRKVLRSMLGFSAGDAYGNLCISLRWQSVPVILNRFGGPALNAAVGLNLSISGAVSQFGMTILSAFRPQIIQQYAGGDLGYMQRLMANCAKYSLLMYLFFAVPAIIVIDYLLDLWLVEVPAYTAIFCRLTLVAGAAELLVLTLNCGVHATGHIKRMSIITGTIYLIEIPLMWWLLWMTRCPWIVYAVHIVVLLVIIATVAFILHRLMPEFSFFQFMRRGIMPPVAVVVPAAILAVAAAWYVPAGWMRFLASGFVSTLTMAILAWRFAVDPDTRSSILRRIRRHH